LPLDFGVLIAQQGLTYDEIRAVAVEADRIGFDSIWLYDHLFWSEQPFLECWTTLSCLAREVRRIRLGTLVACYSFRQPSLLAKMAATLDNLTEGRLVLGLGAGTSLQYHEREVTSYGFSFPTPRVRIDQLREYVSILREMWTHEEASYTGRYYSVHKAKCNPKPVQKPGPPIIIAGSGDRFLKMAVDLADGYNYWGSPQEYAKRIATLNKLCKNANRDPAILVKSWHISGVIEEDREQARRRLQYYKARDIIQEPMFEGSPKDWIDLMGSYVKIGVSGFQVWFLDGAVLEPLRIFAREVIPELRRIYTIPGESTSDSRPN